MDSLNNEWILYAFLTLLGTVHFHSDPLFRNFRWYGFTYVGILDDWPMQKSKKLKIILANIIDCFKVLFYFIWTKSFFLYSDSTFFRGRIMNYEEIIWVRHIIAWPCEVFFSPWMIQLAYQPISNVHQFNLNKTSCYISYITSANNKWKKEEIQAQKYY